MSGLEFDVAGGASLEEVPGCGGTGPSDPAANLPALIADLPDDPAPTTGRKPQLEFTRAAQVAFLEALAVTGSVRSAASHAQVSRQTVYRVRRANAALRRCMDAAKLQALARAEDMLADRAIDGVEEKVFYHGEEVATRRRYDSRLLLAHIGRLDKMAGHADVRALSDDFDAVMARFAAGEELPDPPAPGSPVDAPAGNPPAENPPGQCNTCHMSNNDAREQADADAYADVGADADAEADAHADAGADPAAEPSCSCAYADDARRPHFRRGPEGLEPVNNAGGGMGPCCDDPDWPRCRACPHYPVNGRVMEEMAEARPADAPALPPGEEGWDIEERQVQAFAAGDPEWWTVGLEDRDAAAAVVEVKSAGPAAPARDVAPVEPVLRTPCRVEPVDDAPASTVDEPCALARRKAGFGPVAGPALRVRLWTAGYGGAGGPL